MNDIRLLIVSCLSHIILLGLVVSTYMPRHLPVAAPACYCAMMACMTLSPHSSGMCKGTCWRKLPEVDIISIFRLLHEIKTKRSYIAEKLRHSNT